MGTISVKQGEQRVESGERYLVVMTATIIPAATVTVERADPALRLEDYKRALRFWLAYRHPAMEQILLIENSGADLSELREIAERENPLAKAVEILSVPAAAIPAWSNYGYAEMRMLDEGLAQSRLRQTTTHMIKVTGRLMFPTCGRALDKAAKPFEAMIDCRKLGFPRRGHDANTQICFFSHGFYDRVLRGACEEMNGTDVRLLEHLIFRKVIAFKGQPGILLRFPCNVDPVGFSGFSGRPYDSFGTRVVRGIRAVLRVVAPGYWF